MKSDSDIEQEQMRRLSRREAIGLVGALLGGVAFIGGSRLVAAAEKAGDAAMKLPGTFSVEDIAFLDEIAETILPETKTPGAKAAKAGAFMALMVTDCYGADEQKVFRDGMRRLDAATRKAAGTSFMQATAAQRLAVLTTLDREQKRVMDARDAAERRKKGLAPVHADGAPAPDANLPEGQNALATVTTVGDPGQDDKQPAHYFRMMKELALLGYFTSEIGCTIAQRYIETPGRYDACLPYTAGERAWAEHA
jgi:hypothetical protein